MFTIDMEKGFKVSFIINITLAVLLIVMTILYFTKGTKKENENPGIQDMVIENYEIDFKSERYAYLIEVSNDVDYLDITIVPYEKGASISVEGNEKFEEGYNQIVIEVQDTSTTPKYYYIDVIKAKAEENNNADDVNNVQK